MTGEPGRSNDAVPPFWQPTRPSVRGVEIVLGSFVSRDGRWRIQALREGRRYWYRILLDAAVFADGLTRGEVERILRDDAGLELADLIEE